MAPWASLCALVCLYCASYVESGIRRTRNESDAYIAATRHAGVAWYWGCCAPIDCPMPEDLGGDGGRGASGVGMRGGGGVRRKPGSSSSNVVLHVSNQAYFLVSYMPLARPPADKLWYSHTRALPPKKSLLDTIRRPAELQKP